MSAIMLPHYLVDKILLEFCDAMQSASISCLSRQYQHLMHTYMQKIITIQRFYKESLQELHFSTLKSHNSKRVLVRILLADYPMHFLRQYPDSVVAALRSTSRAAAVTTLFSSVVPSNVDKRTRRHIRTF